MRKRYLVPLDGSELAEDALPWAQLLAEKLDGQVELLRCCEPLASVYMVPEFAAPSHTYFDQTAMNDQIDAYLDSLAKRLPDGLTKKTRCDGDAAMSILTRAEADEIAAIVLASHGRGGIGRWLLGSVTTKVVRGGQKPVLVISPSTEDVLTPQVRRILLPLDGSPTSEAAVPKAVELAAAFQAELVFYRCVNHTPLGNPALGAAVKLELAKAQDYLDELCAGYPELKTTVKVEIAGTSKGILSQAEDCDLVVLSSHGRSGVRRWLLGSVTEKVIQSATKPIMVVYKPD
jgi:nucleotide-binding universal stress UspA family protein